ncbi:ParB N-terminal domain-containing protein [Microbacterium sp. NPDC012755]|uniref:ParB N-terminal domain-containing protein n=1 Tax=Microbacterium sp. NPDC012755 TaxID=3364184 RepID=UPI0036AE920A
MLAWLEESSTLEELASSMIQNGFFDHEPLIVRTTAKADEYIVVEGNRRFSTIQILLQTDAAKAADLEFDFDTEPTQPQLDALREVPCVIVSSDEEVRKFLGYRHIGGIKTWSAEAKARYLETEVENAATGGSANPFKDVGKRVGTNALGVRGPYLALKTLKVARDELGLTGPAKVVLRERFGVWNRLLNSAEVRSFIGLGDALDYATIQDRLRHLDRENLAIVLDDMVPPAGSRIALLQDSRDVTTYGRVLAHDAARETLLTSRDLDLAAQVADGSTLPQKLRNIIKSLELIVRNIDSYEIGAEEVESAASVFNTARSLNALVKDRLDGED